MSEKHTAHTPGPWSYADSHDGCCGSWCTPNGCHESHPTGIFVLHGPDAHDPETLGIYGLAMKNEADARLIAAAPTLLEALQTLMDEEVPESLDRWTEACDKARTAIALATNPEQSA